MNFREGQQLLWVPERVHERREHVTVVALLSRGQARLSNGWTVDEDGVASGTQSRPGGRVFRMKEPAS